MQLFHSCNVYQNIHTHFLKFLGCKPMTSIKCLLFTQFIYVSIFFMINVVAVDVFALILLYCS
ncbi:hypothetical protein C5167_008654 [Papaver somniferum]|uniref:Uncharacterized protein n=1 Tax=Papaver somniferum TaxID=3469 RepID=A0A4Y7JV50_PAPSO|nr:hypothetical protein C5167_008654 [Papaver somniferum]